MGWTRRFLFPVGERIVHAATAVSRPAVLSTWPRIQCEPELFPEINEPDHSAASPAEVKNAQRYASKPSWFLIKRNSVTSNVVENVGIYL
jgi:hypothetical protein